MKTSLGIWALGPMITRFVPGGYQPDKAGESMPHKVHRAVTGDVDFRRQLRVVPRMLEIKLAQIVFERRRRCRPAIAKSPLEQRGDRLHVLGRAGADFGHSVLAASARESAAWRTAAAP